MRVLLDTNVLLWSQNEPEKLGKKAAAILLDPKNARYISSISVLEIGQLIFANKLVFSISVEKWLRDTSEALRLEEITVSSNIALSAYQLPGNLHRDPADRIIVSTARELDMSVLTCDEKILSYKEVRSIDARK